MKQHKIRKEISAAVGPAQGMAARERTGVAQDDGAAQARLPLEPRRLTGRTRASARGAGEAASATVELADGEPSGELNSTGVLPKSPRCDCPTNPKL